MRSVEKRESSRGRHTVAYTVVERRDYWIYERRIEG
jgi:hypothetical protein